ncbi:class I SAM-dependent methyltransferase [Microbaculum marinum]|uniref:Class I SAM-dependent methyltransferase n=1 Tax=Microbaculum marinum TaxID=1764581 RepID=A0AAW9RBY8_9HYPH
MAQNIYDDGVFFAAYSRLHRSVRGLEGAPEWPALRDLLPPLAGRSVVDLGCGFGWFVRWARLQGAAYVLGVDLSENMLSRARQATDDPAVDYRRADLETLELPAASFDLAYSSLAFHYIPDLARLARTIRGSLRPGGVLVFSIEHPIFMAPTSPDWMTGPGGRRIWPLATYSAEGARRTNWLAEGVVKYHRTLATTVNTLVDQGFTFRRLVEWAPTPEQLAAAPELAEEVDRPMIAILKFSL